jgi:superfamily I DNA/RNA helicase
MPLPTPKGRQKDVLYLPATGHTVVLGTAGSGKTTLAILRAAYLADPDTEHSGKTLLVTFNKSLVSYLKHLQENGVQGLSVEHYHKFVRGYLHSRGKLGNGQICTPTQRNRYLASALKTVISLETNTSEGEILIQRWGRTLQWSYHLAIEDYAEFLQRSSYSKTDAELFWKIRETYEKVRTSAGKLYDWDDIACVAVRELNRDKSRRLYRHIVLDEGQDFSPAMIRSLIAAVPPDGTISFFGDVAQQIYGGKYAWREAGLTPPKIWKFEENYRNSREIAAFAMEVAKMPYYAGLPDMVTPKQPAAAGPKPVLIRCKSEAKELEFVAKQAIAFSKVGPTAILVRDHQLKSRLEPLFRPSDVQLLHGDMGVWTDAKRLNLGTFHSAKGLEFASVILPFVSDKYLPDPEIVKIEGSTAADAMEGRLLYVGSTRARTNLVLSGTGTLSHLLPPPGNVYEVRDYG